ncbi:AZOBR_p60025 family cell surface glycopolymer formation protein [Crocosphaera sp. Alani8]|uniref:AZOBR_p60025 family cell surface glycopolymer formation protein n=1 Tax=Crocosphaera sp. Alani8 TaxID=3038952 RepID=UPI00313D61BA
MFNSQRDISFSNYINIFFASIFIVFVVLYFYFVKFDSNITGFFRIGSILPLSPFLNPENTLIYEGEIGYDGQQFLSLAFDPFLQNPETINSLDHPIYRYRRILYPLISYFLAFGNSTLIPYVMVAINAVSIVIIVAITNLYFKFDNVSKFQPLFILCIPGVWMVLSLGTADLFSSVFLVASFYCYRYDKYRLTGLFIGLGCLTRETLLIVWFALFLSSLIEKRFKQIKYLLYGLILPIAWTIYITFLDLPGKVRVKDNFGFPFVGIFNKFISILTGGINGRNLFEAYMFIILLLSIMAILVIYLKNRQTNLLIQISNSFYGLMFAFSSMTILGYYLDYSRVFMDVYFLLLLSINITKIPYKTMLFSASGIGSLAFLILHS